MVAKAIQAPTLSRQGLITGPEWKYQSIETTLCVRIAGRIHVESEKRTRFAKALFSGLLIIGSAEV